MESRNSLIFGQEKEMKGFCPICGLPIYDDKGCPKYHKIKKAPKRGRFSGPSKSVNKWNDYR